MAAKIGALVQERNIRVYEVGISYYGRTYQEGKKIKLKDVIRILWCIFIYNTSWFAHLVKYVLFGVLIGVPQLGSIWILVNFFGFHSLWQQENANLLSIAVVLIIPFIIHSKITWRCYYRSKAEIVVKIVKFYAVSLISFIPRVIIFDVLAAQGFELFLEYNNWNYCRNLYKFHWL